MWGAGAKWEFSRAPVYPEESFGGPAGEHNHHGRRSAMKVLVSGSTGFLGSALVEYLKQHGHEVVRLVRHKEGTPEQEVLW